MWVLPQELIGQRARRVDVPKVGIIALLLTLAAATGAGRLPIPPLLLVFALATVGSVLLLLRRQEYGIVLLPLVATAVPLKLDTGTNSPLVASVPFVALLLGVWLARALVQHRIIVVRSPLNGPLLGLALVWILSYFNANATMHPLVQAWPGFPTAQLGGLAIALISFAVLFLATDNLRDLLWIRRLTWVFLGIAAVAIAGYQVAPGLTYRNFATGGLFAMWVTAIAYGQVLFNDQLSTWKRLGLLLLVAAWLYRQAIVYTDWLSGWIPSIVALLVITFFRSKRLFAGLVLALLLTLTLTFESVYPAYEARNSEGDALRLAIWAQAWDLTKDHLLFGTGPAGYGPYYMTFYRASTASMSSHSNYVDIFAQTGLFGSLVFVWFLIAMLWVCRRAQRKCRTSFAAGFANGVYGGFVGVLVAMALGDWLIPFVYNQTIAGFRYTMYSWLFFGALASMEHIKET